MKIQALFLLFVALVLTACDTREYTTEELVHAERMRSHIAFASKGDLVEVVQGTVYFLQDIYGGDLEVRDLYGHRIIRWNNDKFFVDVTRVVRLNDPEYPELAVRFLGQLR